MQTDSHEARLETTRQELQSLLTQFNQRIAEEEDLRAKERTRAFEQDILARQERCTQEFDSQIVNFTQLKEENPNRVQLYVRAEQSARRQYLSSMTFLCDTLRDKIAQS